MDRRLKLALPGVLSLALAMNGAPLTAGTSLASPVPSCAEARHPGGEWPMYGHDYHNTRSQPAEKKIGPQEAVGLEPAWAFSTNGKGDFTGTPVVADGCVYVGSNDGWVFAVNADTGKLVWKTRIPGQDIAINSTAAVHAGRVFFTVSRGGAPSVVALNQDTGHLLWRTQVSHQQGSDIYSSPIVWNGLLFAGWSGGSAELGSDEDRRAFQGGFVLMDEKTGRLLKKTYTIHSPKLNKKDHFAGGGIWSTPAIDTKGGIAYIGSGNPFEPEAEAPTTNSILKIDLNQASPRFGEIIDHYKGNIDNYFPDTRKLPCVDFPGNPPPYYPQGLGKCAQLDMDFGAAPNLYEDNGVLRVGEGQKSGVYHIVNARTMKPISKSLLGIPSAIGGIVGSTAFDGHAIYGPTTQGYLWSINAHDGSPNWVTPVGDGAHYAEAVAVAGGVVYTMDFKGFFDAYDAATGAPLLHRPMEADAGDNTISWGGGVSIARNTVYVETGISGLPTGYVIAYRPGG